MGFYSIVLVANGTISLILAFMASVGSTVMIIAVVKNPLNLIRKPICGIEDVGLALCFLAGTVLLPYFGVTEILQGVNDKPEPLYFPSFISLSTDFLIASKLAIYLIVIIERCIAYKYPHFHRAKITTRSTFFISLLLVTFCFLFSSLSFTGIDEKIYYIVFIHLFCTFSWMVNIFVTWLTYRKLKNRNRIAPDETSQLPQFRERAEFEKARNALGARKYVQKSATFYSPVLFSILPWYVVKCIGSVSDGCFTNNAGFFWQRFSISLAFLTDTYYPLLFYREFGKTVKYIFCKN